jgi:hypothetical protein
VGEAEPDLECDDSVLRTVVQLAQDPAALVCRRDVSRTQFGEFVGAASAFADDRG